MAQKTKEARETAQFNPELQKPTLEAAIVVTGDFKDLFAQFGKSYPELAKKWSPKYNNDTEGKGLWTLAVWDEARRQGEELTPAVYEVIRRATGLPLAYVSKYMEAQHMKNSEVRF